MEKLLLVGSCIIALLVIGWNIKVLDNIYDHQVKLIGGFLLSFTALRYITLLLYSYITQLEVLCRIRYFYFASSIGITILTALAIWYISPFLKERLTVFCYIFIFAPWIFFYGYLILNQPTQIVESSIYQYELLLIPPFDRYLGIAQGSFIFVIVILCVIGLFTYKHYQMRVQYLLILLAQGLFVIDGLYVNVEMVRFFRPFTLTEAFALWTIGYAFSHTIKKIKVGKRI